MGLRLPGPARARRRLRQERASASTGSPPLGFGFVEIGTVTGEPQPGNPRPRLFRLPADRALINRMGFNNDGAAVGGRAGCAGAGDRTGRRPVPSSASTSARPRWCPRTQARRATTRRAPTLLTPYADYLVVNVSSPNTPGLRDLQAVDKLRAAAPRRTPPPPTTVADRHVPLLVKIAPDLADDDVLAVADLAVELGLDGIVATNTTIAREDRSRTARRRSRRPAPAALRRAAAAPGPPRCCACCGRVGADLTLVGVGGIADARGRASQRLVAGADLLQGYTGFVYEGPSWPRPDRTPPRSRAPRRRVRRRR